MALPAERRVLQPLKQPDITAPPATFPTGSVAPLDVSHHSLKLQQAHPVATELRLMSLHKTAITPKK